MIRWMINRWIDCYMYNYYTLVTFVHSVSLHRLLLATGPSYGRPRYSSCPSGLLLCNSSQKLSEAALSSTMRPETPFLIKLELC